jgi:DNA-binding protein H-NS
MIETLKTLTDDDLRGIIDQAGNLLKQRDRERKENALGQARAILAQAGLSLKELSKVKAKNGKGKAPLPAGTKYLNPDNPVEFYIAGKGRPPGWFDKLRAEGNLPEPANDTIKPVAVKRAV